MMERVDEQSGPSLACAPGQHRRDTRGSGERGRQRRARSEVSSEFRDLRHEGARRTGSEPCCLPSRCAATRRYTRIETHECSRRMRIFAPYRNARALVCRCRSRRDQESLGRNGGRSDVPLSCQNAGEAGMWSRDGVARGKVTPVAHIQYGPPRGNALTGPPCHV